MNDWENHLLLHHNRMEPHAVLVPYDDEAALASAMADDVAGVIVEVVQGEGGLAAMTPGQTFVLTIPPKPLETSVGRSREA